MVEHQQVIAKRIKGSLGFVSNTHNPHHADIVPLFEFSRRPLIDSHVAILRAAKAD